jgi:hypothetical protein
MKLADLCEIRQAGGTATLHFSKESTMALRCHPVGNENLVLVLYTGESMSTITSTSTSTRQSATAAALLTPVS